MNHEPIHFLPVERFWETRRPVACRPFWLGLAFVAGFALAAGMFVLWAAYCIFPD